MRHVAPLLCLLVSSIAIAQLAAAQQSQNVSLDAVAARLAGVETLRGRFVQTREITGLSRPLRSSGRYIVSELGLYWEQTEPFEVLTIAGEDGISQRVADLPMARVSATDQPLAAAVSDVFMGILQGDRRQLEAHFELDFDARGTKWTMELSPRDFPLTEVIDRIVVAGDELIDTLRLIDMDGGSLTIGFEGQSTEPRELSAGERDLYAQ